MKRSEAGKLHVEKARRAPELVEAQTHMKKRSAGKEKKRNTGGWVHRDVAGKCEQTRV